MSPVQINPDYHPLPRGAGAIFDDGLAGWGERHTLFDLHTSYTPMLARSRTSSQSPSAWVKTANAKPR